MCVRAGAARIAPALIRGGLSDLEVSQAGFDAAGDAWVEVYASERRALRTLQQARVSYERGTPVGGKTLEWQ